MRKTDIIFIRHGESANNVTYETVRNMFGDTLSPEQFEVELLKLHNPDCALSPKGIKQVEQLSKYLANGGLSKIITNVDEWRIFSSPMNRCLLTTNGISAALNKRATVMPFMYESDGCYESVAGHGTRGLPGMTAAQVQEKFPMFDCAPGMENGWFTLPHKETRRHFAERSKEVSDWLWSLHDQTAEERGFQTGLIFSAHGNLIMSVITNLLQGANMMLTHDNTGFAHVQLWSNEDGSGRLPAVLFTNRVDHLAAHPELVAGGAVFEDHWIQEYMEPLDG
jgi:broad specificity phosphatase PhoE